MEQNPLGSTIPNHPRDTLPPSRPLQSRAGRSLCLARPRPDSPTCGRPASCAPGPHTTSSCLTPLHRPHARRPHCRPRSFHPALEGCRDGPLPPAGIISSSRSSDKPAGIPLQSLTRRPSEEDLLDGGEQQSSPRRSYSRRSSTNPHRSATSANPHRSAPARRSVGSRRSSGSDLTVFGETGDLGEQIADEEDPLRIDIHGEPGTPRGTPYANGHKSNGRITKAGIAKEHIPIPEPAPRKLSTAEIALACVMTRNAASSRRNGLVGKPLLYFTSVFVSLGVFLFGYDQGVMSGIITGGFFKDYFDYPSRAEIGTMVAILEVGAFVASLTVGRVGDILGRKRTILYGSIVFFIGGAFQTFATGMPMMLLGRIVAGLGVGALSTIVPVYQSEISPPHNRGQLACIEFSGNILGYAASVWTDYFCSYIESNYAWRIPLALQCVMGAMLGLGSFLIPESPRWLLDTDRDEEGIVVIANLYGEGDIHNDKARQEYREIKMGVLLQRQEGERSYAEMFKRYSKRVFIAMSAQAGAQLNGINVISYYAPLVFDSAGWHGRMAILMTGINAITYLLSTILPWYVVDKWGRRKILMCGAVAMVISLSLMSYFLYLDLNATPTLTVILVMVYNAAFGASWGPIPWLYPPEILPLSIRAKGASLSTATNWAFNWLVGEVTPVLQEAIKWRLYLLHAFFCAASFVLVYFIYPETANVSLEDMDKIFGDATTAMPTPQQESEVEALMSPRSPIPALDIQRPGEFSSEHAIPGLDIDPPTGQQGHTPRSEGIGGWITRMINRSKSNRPDADAGGYGRVEQDDS